MSQPNIPHCDCIGTPDEDSFCRASYLKDLEELSEVTDLIAILPDYVQFRVDL
jgi:hypothetical protein